MDLLLQEEHERSSRARVERMKAMVKQKRSSGVSKRVMNDIRTNQNVNMELLESFVQSKPLHSSMRQSRKYSTEAEPISPPSCIPVPWARTSKRRSTGKVDPLASIESPVPKGRVSKVSNSLARVACVTGLVPYDSRDEEMRLDEQVKRVLREDRDDSPDTSRNMKVAFLSDLYVDDSSSQGHDDTTQGASSTRGGRNETSQRQHQPLTYHETESTFTGMSRRMKTSTLALLESINDDAGLWLGLRRDSFDLAPGRYTGQRDGFAAVETASSQGVEIVDIES